PGRATRTRRDGTRPDADATPVSLYQAYRMEHGAYQSAPGLPIVASQETAARPAGPPWSAASRRPPGKERAATTDEQKDVWAGVLLAALVVGGVLGGLLVLWLTGN